MKITEVELFHKVNKCVENAYNSIMSMRAVENIWTAYKTPSIYKVKAWQWCKEHCHKNSGYGLCVTAWNTSKFTCAYFCKHHELGWKCLVVITANNIYWCFVDELDEI